MMFDRLFQPTEGLLSVSKSNASHHKQYRIELLLLVHFFQMKFAQRAALGNGTKLLRQCVETLHNFHQQLKIRLD